MNRTSTILLTTMAVGLALLRLHTYDEPLERDLCTYAVIGHEALEGRELYSDLIDHKPPAIYSTFALAELVVGYGPQAIYLLGVAAAIATLLGVYAAGVAASGRRDVGLWAAAFWTVISGDLHLQANQPNTEVFINACMIWALALVLQVRGPDLELRKVLAIGALFALASLYKQTTVVVAAAVCAAHVLVANGSLTRRRAALQVSLTAAVGAACWIGVCGYFGLAGRWDSFYDWVFRFNRQYAGSAVDNLFGGLRPHRLLPSFLIFGLTLLLPAVAAMVRGFSRGPRRPWLLLASFLLGTYASIALPGKFFPHYYQLWLPVLALGGGLAVGVFAASDGPRRWAGRALPVVMLAILCCVELPAYRLSAATWSEMKYGRVYNVITKLAERIDWLLVPGETFYLWGTEPAFYFYTKRTLPTGPVSAFMTLESWSGELSEEVTRRTLADLRRVPPPMVVVEPHMLYLTPTDHPVFRWIQEHYVTFHSEDNVLLMARRGSALARRVSPRPAPRPVRGPSERVPDSSAR